MKPLNVAITGAAGQISYSLLMQIAQQGMANKRCVNLSLIDLPNYAKQLEGVVMELNDTASPYINSIRFGSDINKLFEGVEFVFFIGAKPRGKGETRADLMSANFDIFRKQGEVVDAVCSDDLKVLVVGNPCNTNCWVLSQFTSRYPKNRFHAMTRLDQHRAMAMASSYFQKPVSKLKSAVIWGNHSATQVPDIYHCTTEHPEISWMRNTLLPNVQNRGAQIIEYRGLSSAGSAAYGALKAADDLLLPTKSGHYYSTATYDMHNTFGLDNDLVFSYPARTLETGEVVLCEEIRWPEYFNDDIQRTVQELQNEKALVENLLKTTGGSR
ncbi:malate dehydrogenase [Chlamydiia bacterium]|jgi:malate dehydrogenase|nr:malate dehydrogenase [Chlamydiia bacterium]